MCQFVDQAQPAILRDGPPCRSLGRLARTVFTRCHLAVGFECSACRATTLEEGTLTVRWAIRKKLLASKRTRLTLRIREPEFLFTLIPRIAAYITEGQGAASLNSNPKALVSVRCLQGSVAHPGLHLVSASSGSESEEIHHNFDSNPYCLLPLPVDL